MKLHNRHSMILHKSGLAILCGFLIAAGCDMGLDQSSNRYEQLNIETRKLLDVLKQITDEASAKAHQSELQEAADKVRKVQKGIADSEEKNAKEGTGGGAMIANHRQMTLFQTTGDSARRQVERIRQADAKAGAIVDKAVEGIDFPTSNLTGSGPPGT